MPLKKPLAQRLIEAASRSLSAFSGGLWGGPGDPQTPDKKDLSSVEIVRRPYLPGMNLSRITKAEDRVYTGYLKDGVSFLDLRVLADTHEITRSVIDLCKDQIKKQKLDFKLIVDLKETPDEYRERSERSTHLKALQKFFQSPDGEHTLRQWIGLIIEEMLVTDALSIAKLTNLNGDIIGLDIIDGTTIQPLLDRSGRRPRPPFPAYQQIIDGRVVAEFTSEELLYMPRNQRVHKLYGQSPVEQVITYINIGLRRLAFQLNHYTEGNIPAGFKDVPETWTPDQIEQFQEYWDELFLNNTAAKSKLKFVPGGGKDPVFPKKDVLSDEFDEWLARVICHCFSVSPNTFIRNLNRAVSDQQREQADEEGMFARMAYLKDVIDYIIQVWFGFTDCEAIWTLDRPQDSHKQAEIDVMYVKHGIKSIDEIRKELGMHPIGVGHGILLSSGMIFLAKDRQDQEDQLTTTTQIILTDRDKSNDPEAPSPEEKANLSPKAKNPKQKKRVRDEQSGNSSSKTD